MNDKQAAFVNEYLLDFNATQAALRAGYSEKTAYSIGWENLKKPEIAKRIQERLAEKTMTADEVLVRLSEQARASFKDFIVIEGEYSWRFDMEKIQASGHLVKSISTSKNGVRIELYDAQAALRDIGKHHGLFTDRVEHSGEVAQIGMTLEEWRAERQKRQAQADETLALFDENDEETP